MKRRPRYVYVSRIEGAVGTWFVTHVTGRGARQFRGVQKYAGREVVTVRFSIDRFKPGAIGTWC